VWGSRIYRHSVGLEIRGEQRSSHPPCLCSWTEAQSHIPDDLVHVVAFGGKDFGIMHLDVMVMVESLLYGWWFVRVSKLDVPVVVFHPGQNTFHLSNKDITIFTGDALHIHSFQPHVILYR